MGRKGHEGRVVVGESDGCVLSVFPGICGMEGSALLGGTTNFRFSMRRIEGVREAALEMGRRIRESESPYHRRILEAVANMEARMRAEDEAERLAGEAEGHVGVGKRRRNRI